MLEERINQCDQIRAIKIYLERIDVAIKRLLNHARKKVEGRGKGVPCSREKFLCWSELAYWKLWKKQGLNQTINKESMASKKRIARIVDNTSIIDDIDA